MEQNPVFKDQLISCITYLNQILLICVLVREQNYLEYRKRERKSLKIYMCPVSQAYLIQTSITKFGNGILYLLVNMHVNLTSLLSGSCVLMKECLFKCKRKGTVHISMHMWPICFFSVPQLSVEIENRQGRRLYYSSFQNVVAITLGVQRLGSVNCDDTHIVNSWAFSPR